MHEMLYPSPSGVHPGLQEPFSLTLHLKRESRGSHVELQPMCPSREPD